MAVIKTIQPVPPGTTAELIVEPVNPVPAQVATAPTVDPAAVAAIVGAYHSTPFDILGIHPYDAGGKPAIVIRTFQPQAQLVSVVAAGQTYPMQRIHPDGFFETVILNRTAFMPYRLAITLPPDAEGRQKTYEIEDPYRYPPV